MPQASCSPDLAPADFFLLTKLKTAMKGKRFATIEEEIKEKSKQEQEQKRGWIFPLNKTEDTDERKAMIGEIKEKSKQERKRVSEVFWELEKTLR